MIAQTKASPVKKLIQQNKLTTEEVARQTKLSLSSLNRLMTGGNNDPRLSTLTPLASFFNVSIDELVGRKPLKNHTQQEHDLEEQGAVHVPLIHWEQVTKIDDMIQNMDFNNWDYWAVAICEVSTRAYALKINNTSLPLPFSKGATIIVDPETKPADGDHVILIYESNPVLCRVIVDGAITSFKSLVLNELFIIDNKINVSGKKLAGYSGCLVQCTVTRNI